MKRRCTIAAAALVSLLVARPDAASAQEVSEVHQALLDELERSASQLELADAPPIYHVRFSLLERAYDWTLASHGAVVEAVRDPSNRLGVEIRVGTPEFDNTNFGGWETGFAETGLPDVLTVDSVRNETWLIVDNAFKKAVEQHARKQAQWTPPEDHPGDFQMVGPWEAASTPPEPVPEHLLRDIAVDLSGSYPAGIPLDRAEVHASHHSGTLLVLDTQGTRVSRPVESTILRALAHARLPDGSMMTDHCTWIVAGADQLPPHGEQVACVEGMVQDLARQAEAAPLDEEYVGPVLFEGDAALGLFTDLLAPQIEGTPAVTSFNTLLGGLGESFADSEGGPGDVRVGRRVLPSGWTAFDDPRLDPHNPAAFDHDQEGTPAQRVNVVTDGITRDLLMSRIPRKDHAGTNGHARGRPGYRLPGRVSQLVVEPPRRFSAAQLRKRALKEAASYGHDHVLVVRRLEDDAIRYHGDIPTLTFSAGADGMESTFRLPRPLHVFRLHADGREEPVRNLTFASVHRWVLRDIVAAGPQHQTTYLAPALSGQPTWAPTAGLPTFISAPNVLIGEMEIVPVSGDPKDAHVVPPPTP